MKKILVIEDDQNIRESIEDLLMLKEYEVTTAQNGLEGVKLAKKEYPDLVICDIMMPGLDGYGVLEQLRDESSTMNTPFIFLTAKSQRGDMREGMNLGADDYLTKPFVSEELFEAIESRLQRHELNYDKALSETRVMGTKSDALLGNEVLDPLRGIVKYASLIRDNIDHYSKEEIVEIGELIRTSARGVSRKVRNILLFQALRSMKHDRRVSQSLSTGVVRNGSTLIRDIAFEIAEKHDRPLDLMLQVVDAKLMINEPNFRTICTELIENAFQYSTRGTVVQIYTEKRNSQYFLRIKNLGKKVREYVLELVDTEDILTDMNQASAGVGLYLSSRLVSLNGGTLSYRYDEEGLNEFVVTLNSK